MRTTLAATSALMAGIVTAQFGPYTAFAPQHSGWKQVIVTVFDSDGDNDLLGVDESGNLWWWANDGPGDFADVQPFTALGLQRISEMVEAADLDNDGDMDLITALYDPSIVDSTRWFRNDGGLSFSPRPAFDAPYLYRLWYGEALDTDLDGDLDVVAYNDGDLHHFRNLDGLGTFSSAVASTSIAGVQDIDAGDMDDDGDNDLLVTSHFSVSWTFHRLGNTDGIGGAWNQVLVGTGTEEFGCAWIDIDGDGDLDATATKIDDLNYAENTDGLGTLSALTTSGLGTGLMHYWKKLDYDNDGDLDVIGATDHHLVWLEQLVPGSFVVHASVDGPVLIEGLGMGDLDGDGDADAAFVATGGRAIGWVEHTPGGFGAWHYTALEPSDPVDLTSADMDGDGDMDAVVAATTNNSIGWYPNTDANGTFGEFELISFSADSVLAIDVADVDGDTDMDVVAAEGRSGELSWFENTDGLGTAWQEHTVATGLAMPNLLHAVDLDHDGDEDIVFTTYLDHLVRYCLNTSGSFGAPQLIADPVFLPVALEIADLNGDAWMEVIVAGQTGSTNDIIWYQGLFGGITFGGAHIEVNNTSLTVAVHAADLDGDGDNDLVYSHQGTGRLSWLQNNGAGTFQPSVDILNNPQINDVLPVDVDSDGAMDLLCIKVGNGGAIWVHSLGGGAFAPLATLTTELHYGTDILSADMDQDGDPDLLMCGNQKDDVATIENYFGSPYRISGTVFLDLDADGTSSAGDMPATFIPVTCAPYMSTPYSAADGSYTLYVEEGSFAVSAPLAGSCWTLSTPSSTYNETLTALQPAVTGRDFGYAIGCDTTVVNLSASGLARCTIGGRLDVHLYNTGTTRPQGTLRVILDPLTPYVTSSWGTSAEDGDTLWFTLDPIDYFQQPYVSIYMAPAGVDHVGDTLHYTIDLFAEDDQGTPLGSFSSVLTPHVQCAYDPNEKIVVPAGHGTQGLIPVETERLTYTIRFQNTGNDTANTVVLYDALSPNLDLSTLHVLGWTHPFTLTIEGDRVARFTFANINLPDSTANFEGSQGHVIFSIDPVEGLPQGTLIENTADIVFDLNPPIVTNTTLNTLYDCALAQALITDLGSGALSANSGTAYQWLLGGVPIPGANEQFYVAPVSGIYSVMVTDSLGCTPVSESIDVVLMSVEEGANDALRCAPSVFTDHTTLLLPQNVTSGTFLHVLDAQGRLCASMPITQRVMDLPGADLPSGILILRISSPINGKVLVTRVTHLR